MAGPSRESEGAVAEVRVPPTARQLGSTPPRFRARGASQSHRPTEDDQVEKTGLLDRSLLDRQTASTSWVGPG